MSRRAGAVKIVARLCSTRARSASRRTSQTALLIGGLAASLALTTACDGGSRDPVGPSQPSSAEPTLIVHSHAPLTKHATIYFKQRGLRRPGHKLGIINRFLNLGYAGGDIDIATGYEIRAPASQQADGIGGPWLVVEQPIVLGGGAYGYVTQTSRPEAGQPPTVRLRVLRTHRPLQPLNPRGGAQAPEVRPMTIRIASGPHSRLILVEHGGWPPLSTFDGMYVGQVVKKP